MKACPLLTDQCNISLFPTEEKLSYYTPPHMKKYNSGKLGDRYKNQMKFFKTDSPKP